MDSVGARFCRCDLMCKRIEEFVPIQLGVISIEVHGDTQG